MNEKLISDLTDEQIDELLKYTPTFTKTSLDNIKARAIASVNTKPERKFKMKKIFLTVAAAAMLLVMSTAVLAAVTGFELGHIFNSFFNNPNVDDVMHVGKTVEENGIEITLQYAYTDGNEAYAMLKLRDMQGNRLNDNTRLVFDINNPAFLVTPIVYDERQNQAQAGISIVNWDTLPLEIGDYLSLVVESILLDANNVWQVPLEFSLLNAIEGDMPKNIPGIDWAEISGIGYNSGLFHIEYRRTDAWCHSSNWGILGLIDEQGDEIIPISNRGTDGYVEIVFEINNLEDLAEARLAFSGLVVQEIITGPWEFTFPITTMAETVELVSEIYSSLYFSDFYVNISPMITTIGYNAMACEEEANNLAFLQRMRDYVNSFNTPHITLVDGSKVELFQRDTMFGASGGHFVFTTLYFNISDIYSITVLGVEYPLDTNTVHRTAQN